MIAFHGEEKNKKAILKQLKAHYRADEIVKGQYWEDGKGCAVGCTVHSDSHAAYETQFGIPQMLARLEDTIFEGLPNDKAKEWPILFMRAIHPGADLSRVGWKFLHWILTDSAVNPGIDHPLMRDAVRQCADVLVPLTKGMPVDRSAAWSAARSAWSAARSAEAAAWSARSAAWSAARSAEAAAWSAEAAALPARSAAWSAAESAATWSADAAALSARSAAWSAAELAAARSAYELMAIKLIELLWETRP